MYCGGVVSFNMLFKMRFKIIKGTHTVYFSSSLSHHKSKAYMIPRTDFNCITTWAAPSSG